MLADRPHGLRAVGSRAHDIDVVDSLKRQRDAVACEGLVVDYERAQHPPSRITCEHALHLIMMD